MNTLTAKGGNAIPLTAMKKNIKYKLVDIEGFTRRGCKNQIYWLDGIEQIASGNGKDLCCDDVIHYYDSPDLAVLYNVIHANIENPCLIVLKIDKCIAHDGLKGGCKKAKFVQEILLPIWMMEKRVEFAIRISLIAYKDEGYVKWAKDWLSGKDRTIKSIDKITAETNVESHTAKTSIAEWAVCGAMDAINAARNMWIIENTEGVSAACAVDRIIKNVATVATAVSNTERAKRFLQFSLNIITQIKGGN